MARIRIGTPNPVARNVLVTSLLHKRDALSRREGYVESAQSHLAECLAAREEAREEVKSLEGYMNDNFPGWEEEVSSLAAEQVETGDVDVENKIYRVLAEGWTDQRIRQWWITPNSELDNQTPQALADGARGHRQVLSLAREIAEDFDDD